MVAQPLARPWRTNPARARRALNRAPLLFYALSDDQSASLSALEGTTVESKTYYEFVINPARLKVTKVKLESWILTKFGYERQFWQNDLFKFEYSGSTGAFVPSTDGAIASGPAALASDGFDITQTKAWKLFQEFEQFYLEVAGEKTIAMHFWAFQGFHFGCLNNFSYNVASDDPFRITYNFTFTGIPRANVRIVSSKESTAATDGPLSVGVQGFPARDGAK